MAGYRPILSEDFMRCQIWLKQSTVTHPAVYHNEVVNQQFAACSGSPHDDNHLTSLVSCLVLPVSTVGSHTYPNILRPEERV